MNAIEVVADFGLKATPVGSRVTCDPPPTDTDADYLVYVTAANLGDFNYLLDTDQWVMGGSHVGDGNGDGWQSWRKGEDNLIVCYHRATYDYFLAATACAKRLNLLEKADRVALFKELEKHWPGMVQPEITSLDPLDFL